ncbi:unnamed protein product [Ambrosiozyma monospora]|uniref:Unnamed protein product n=1 Tax=Ambrosiozyma monospora TaxID=43982 RepID=A0A9W7DKA8_AMBMO|nr:unnamed protein product [Ambrosiozyma monospora]
MVGGGIYSWYAYLAIQGLRTVGSVLPVEVLLPKEEDYEADLCEKNLPSLNAKCIMMPTVFGKENMEKFDLTGYQFKSFALLGSSFENTFLLDSDSFAVKNPDELFTSDLFLNLEMITWPDFWKRTTSPYYYQVAGIPIGKTPVRRMNDIFTDPTKFYKDSEIENYKQKIEFHDRSGAIPDWTSESGELLIRKSTHFDALLLSAYYNADGPQGYHPLLSQGGAGEGDKETFIAASRFYNKPYYQVYRQPDRLYGYYKDKGKGEWDHTTIAQFDPLQDFAILKKVIKNIRTKIEVEGDEFKYDYDELFRKPWNDNDKDLKPMFYHVHNPKMDPFYIQDQKITQNPRGGPIRNIGGEFNRWLDFDFENWLYETMREDLFSEKLKFACFKDKEFGEIDGWLSKRIDFLRRSNTRILLGQEVKWNKFEPLQELSYEEDQMITAEIWDKFFQDVPFSEVDERGRSAEYDPFAVDGKSHIKQKVDSKLDAGSGSGSGVGTNTGANANPDEQWNSEPAANAPVDDIANGAAPVAEEPWKGEQDQAAVIDEPQPWKGEGEAAKVVPDADPVADIPADEPWKDGN